MVARQGFRSAIQGERRTELLLEPWQRMGVCRSGEGDADTAKERQGLQGTEERLPPDEQGSHKMSARRRFLER